MEMSGLDRDMLGRPGLQENNIRLFVEGKQQELIGKKLCLSVAVDGKKIAVVDGEKGREDLGGVGSDYTPDEIDKMQHQEKTVLLEKLKTKSRETLNFAESNLLNYKRKAF